MKQIIQWLGNLTHEQRQLLLQLIKQDGTALEKLLSKISRLHFAMRTGDVLLWKRILDQEEKDLLGFIQETGDHKRIIQIKRELEIKH